VISRRAVSRGILLALLAAPLATAAQPGGTVYRIGFLGNTPITKDPASQRFYHAFVQALREAGWVEGQNTIIERRYSDGHMERFPDLAAELARLNVDVIVTSSVPAARAAKRATTTIPIVAIGMSDPVGAGLVASLARPGGNITGSATLFPELAAKRLALFKETLPKSSRVAVLKNAANPGNLLIWKEVQVAGRALGVTVYAIDVPGPDDVEGGLGAMIKDRPQGLLVLDDPLFVPHRTSIVKFAAKHKLPAIYPFREYAEAGGLMAYSVNLLDLARHAATSVDKILRGAKPADLPIEQPTTFELVINLRTARALGLTIPQTVLQRADRIIQ
jgi:putative ABC transport system substrate-binding protein